MNIYISMSRLLDGCNISQPATKVLSSHPHDKATLLSCVYLCIPLSLLGGDVPRREMARAQSQAIRKVLTKENITWEPQIEDALMEEGVTHYEIYILLERLLDQHFALLDENYQKIKSLEAEVCHCSQAILPAPLPLPILHFPSFPSSCFNVSLVYYPLLTYLIPSLIAPSSYCLIF